MGIPGQRLIACCVCQVSTCYIPSYSMKAWECDDCQEKRRVKHEAMYEELERQPSWVARLSDNGIAPHQLISKHDSWASAQVTKNRLNAIENTNRYFTKFDASIESGLKNGELLGIEHSDTQ